MGLTPFLLALAYRSLFLLFPQTHFQPDEFWQSLEPAHNHVFGYGHLTWEWRDLPDGGRMRGWLWPSIFVGVYRTLQWAGLDDTFLLASPSSRVSAEYVRLIICQTFAPRMVGVVVAAATDWATYRLSAKLMGPGSAAGAFFLSTTSLFHAYALPRTLSNSPETLLTTLALVYFPFRPASTPQAIIVGHDGLVASHSMKDLTKARSRNTSGKGYSWKEGGEGDEVMLRLNDTSQINYAVMDRLGPDIAEQEGPLDSLVLSLFFAGLAMCIRTTTLPMWIYLGLEYWLRVLRRKGVIAAVHVAWLAVMTGTTAVAFSTAIDYHFTGKVYLHFWSFFQQNVLHNIAAFYGKTTPLYHLTQSLPILLLPIWYWWIKGFGACVLPSRFTPSILVGLDRPAGMRSLARAITFGIFVLSFSPHSEWRFVHPYLPALLMFALPPLFRSYTPTIIGAYRFTDSLRQYTRMPKRAFYLILLSPILPYFYLSLFHGRAQVAVMELLRGGRYGDVTSLAVITNCHSTPWQSHLHRDVPAWFPRCEPPLGQDPVTYKSEATMFFDDPHAHIDDILTVASTPGHSWTGHDHPSHVIAYGSMLDRVGSYKGTDRSIRQILQSHGYIQVWTGWNGFDWAQDDDAKGQLHLWAKEDAHLAEVRPRTEDL